MLQTPEGHPGNTTPTTPALPALPATFANGSTGSPNTPSSARNGVSSMDELAQRMGQLLPSPGKLRSPRYARGSPARTLEVHNWPKLAAPWRVPAELTGQD